MGKYEPLRRHLEAAGNRAITMTFAEVADLVGGLPPSAHRYREWWSNNAGTSAPRTGWLAAGRRVVAVEMGPQLVTFDAPGTAPTRSNLTARAGSARSPKRRSARVERSPDPVSLSPDEVTALEAFLTFRGESSHLRYRIAEVERSVQGLGAAEALAAAGRWGVNHALLEGARLAKAISAQVNVVVHAAGILHALPYILEPGEVVESVSLGAGNTGRAHDLETDRRIAEFKFVGWVGGAETVRQDNLLIDLFHLASEDTDKRRVMYVTGSAIPLHWLRTSRRATRECLARRRRIPPRFDEEYGPASYAHVCEYWAAIEELVEVIDLTDLVPGLAPVLWDGGVGR